MKFAFLICLIVTSGKIYISRVKQITKIYIQNLLFIVSDFVVMSIVTVRNVEAKRLLLEEIPQLHHEGSPQVVKLLDDDCMDGCHMKCIPNNRITPCLCLC